MTRAGRLITGFSFSLGICRLDLLCSCVLFGLAKLARCLCIPSVRFTFIINLRGSSRNSTECPFRCCFKGLSYPQSASSGKNALGGIHLRISSNAMPPTSPSSQHAANNRDAIAVRWSPGGIKFAQLFIIFPYDTASGETYFPSLIWLNTSTATARAWRFSASIPLAENAQAFSTVL